MDFCCRDDTCELAIFSRGFHCYGVSCDDPELCHKILDRLLMEDERQLQRDPRNAGEILNGVLRFSLMKIIKYISDSKIVFLCLY